MYRPGDKVRIDHEFAHIEPSRKKHTYEVVSKELLGWRFTDDGMYCEYVYRLMDMENGETLCEAYNGSQLSRVSS